MLWTMHDLTLDGVMADPHLCTPTTPGPTPTSCSTGWPTAGPPAIDHPQPAGAVVVEAGGHGDRPAAVRREPRRHLHRCSPWGGR